jgi:hypothetical protein
MILLFYIIIYLFIFTVILYFVYLACPLFAGLLLCFIMIFLQYSLVTTLCCVCNWPRSCRLGHK